MKKCIICNSKKLKPMRVKEMMFGTNETFEYMICNTCGSLGLSEVPKNLEDYYPENYYSFSNSNQNKLISSIKHQKDKHSLGEKNIIGYIFNLIFSEDSNLKAINYCNKAKSSAEILDIDTNFTFPHSNITKNKPSTPPLDLYNTESLKLLKKIYQEDFKQLQYDI